MNKVTDEMFVAIDINLIRGYAMEQRATKFIHRNKKVKLKVIPTLCNQPFYANHYIDLTNQDKA